MAVLLLSKCKMTGLFSSHIRISLLVLSGDKRSCNLPINIRVSTVREKVREKNIFSRSGNCQGILEFVREFWNLSESQGKVREF